MLIVPRTPSSVGSLSLAFAFAMAAVAAAQMPSVGGQTPWAGVPTPSSAHPSGSQHPAVVRVIVPDRDGQSMSLGSGALVAVADRHGLVVTNWHVVRDAYGPIYVAFPDGFRSSATLLRTDRDWDLAALAIWRPNASPIPLSNSAPQPGEPLTIAGYGSGSYRSITGRCTQYVSPGLNQPFEIVELSAPARQGDSGGPILNSRGELAGVLFGTAGGRTSGSYCGRVRGFLTSVVGDFQRLQAADMMIAQQTPASNSPSRGSQQQVLTPVPTRPQAATVAGQYGSNSQANELLAANPQWLAHQPVPLSGENARAAPTVSLPSGPPAAIAAPSPATGQGMPEEISGWELGRNLLAVAGAVLIFFHLVAFMTATGAAPSPSEDEEEEDEDDE